MAFAELIYLYIIFVISTSIGSGDVITPADINRRLSKKPERSAQISAVLLECPGGERSEPPMPDCERQMMVHIRMSSTFQIDSMDKFLLLDEVYDERRHAKAKLMAPYVIEVGRGEPVIMYPLEFAQSIRCDTGGHGNDNSTTFNTGELCAKNSHLSPSAEDAKPATVSDDTKLNAPIRSSPKEHHPARSAKAEVKTDEQQSERSSAQRHQQQPKENQDDSRHEGRFIDNEDSAEETDEGAGAGKPSAGGESNDGLTIGLVAVDDGNLVRFQSRSGAAEEELEDGYEYDVDENDDANGDEPDHQEPDIPQDISLRSRLVDTKRLFHERHSEETRLATINALQSNKNPKAHGRIRQGSLKEHFRAPLSEQNTMADESRRRGGNQRIFDDMEAMPHLTDATHNQEKWVNDQYPMEGMLIYPDRIRSNVGNLNRETASLMPGAEHLLHPPQQRSDELHGRQGSPYSADEEEITALDYRDEAAARELAPASNIARIDDSAVGDEFDLNAPDYPQGREILAKRDGGLKESSRRANTRQRLKVKPHSVKDSGRRPHEAMERAKLSRRPDNSDPKPHDRSASSRRSSCKFSALTDKMTARRSNAPGDAAVVPNFPLSGHPGLHRSSVDSQSTPTHKLLEKVPQEHQTRPGNEMENPNLTSPQRRWPTLKESRPKSPNKRSYLVYDDLTMRDTNADYDEVDDKIPLGVPIVNSRISSTNVHGLCDERLCGEKSEDGTSCRCDRNTDQCKCGEKSPSKKICSASETWYSVFNMSAPLPYLTTRIGIYRKRHDTWSKIVPSVTLTSLSGTYASGNLSILFSSHVDILQLKRPLGLHRRHKLVVPRNSEEENAFSEPPVEPGEILAVDSTKFDLNAIQDGNKASRAKERLCRTAAEAKNNQRRQRSHSVAEGVVGMGDLGYFPTQMKPMEECPTGDKHLCLNLLDEEVPAFSVKIKLPFVGNGLVFADLYRVRIIAVVSDATTRGALQVAVVLVNDHLVAHEFAVCICDCPMICGAKTTVKKVLPPHSAERLSFLLPLEETTAKRHQCAVEVKSPDQKVISKRKFMVEPTARCLCIWDCGCHCVPDLVSHEEYNVCRKLGKNDEHWAGLIEAKGTTGRSLPGWGLFWRQTVEYTLALLFVVLLLGFLKASLGAVGLHRINRMGYDYVQPLLKYEHASRWRRFFINTLFFVVLPIFCWCKCFMPSEEDLLLASSEWQYSLLQQDVSDDSSDDSGGGAAGGTDGGGGRANHHRRVRYGNNINDDDDDDEEETILSQHFESGEGSQAAEAGLGRGRTRLNEYLVGACEYDDDEEERDTNYVLQALTESRESIRKLLNTQSNGSIDPQDPLARQAEEHVRRLVAAKIVYRIFDKPLQNVDVPEGQRYSIRGYFVPSAGPGYQYFTPSPLAQLRRITANTSAILLPPVMLRAEQFSREYSSKVEVLQAGDLSVNPPGDAPCINSSNVADPSQLTQARTLDISASQVTKLVGGDGD